MKNYNNHIRYLTRKEIDVKKWDEVISQNNGLLYGLSTYLDGVCPNWTALVADDYDFIMPLPNRSKFGISYLYQPIGFAQGGIFSKQKPTQEIETAFIHSLMNRFRYCNTPLNENFNSKEIKGCKITVRNNYVLHLNKTYEILFSQYNADGIKNIKKAKSLPQHISYDSTPKDTIKLYLEQYGTRINIKKLSLDYISYAKYLSQLIRENLAFNICAKSNAGELLASCIFGIFNNRIYYLLGAPSTQGRKFRSVQLVLDAVIHQYAKSNYMLDFEGSDILSVATLYKKFGSELRPYKSLHFNHLPFPLNKLKK